MNIEKEKQAIQYLQSFEPQDEPYYLAYSGGKDSDVIKTLARLAGVKYEAVHNLTTVDAPETVRYIRSQPDVKISRPKLTMWDLIEKKSMPPTRLVRYCCEELKERKSPGRLVVTGVRWAESAGRKKSTDVVTVRGKPKTTAKTAESMDLDYRVNKFGGVIVANDNTETRKFVESCYRESTFTINPIVDWSDADVWEFLRHYGIAGNPLYAEGFTRVGCVMCPLAGSCTMKKEAARWPKYAANYIKAFDRMIARRKERGLATAWNSGEECFTWWIGDDPDQIDLLSFVEE